MTRWVYCSLKKNCSFANTQLLWFTIYFIGFMLLNMHLHVCRLLSFLISGTILEQSLSSLSPSAVVFFFQNSGCLGKQPLYHPQN
ncbi:hypothetical protein H5410_027598 [Solanum commersonii]|uniref:Uncharacterized protein n=1 Tax=Solanum commersonii TaxID=4109 RepID=A0A9J5Z0B0_SOLCO|nr:hypothetical protein H5410_027598 [Solanum commersonii]